MSNLCLSYEFSDTRECGWFLFVETIREISIGPSIVRALQNFKDPAILRLGIHLVLQVPHSTIQIEKNANCGVSLTFVVSLVAQKFQTIFLKILFLPFPKPSWQISLRPWLVMQCRYFQAWTLNQQLTSCFVLACGTQNHAEGPWLTLGPGKREQCA